MSNNYLSRDEFIELMINELKNQQINQENNFIVKIKKSNEIFTSLCFDYPIVSLDELITLYKDLNTDSYSSIPNWFYYNDKFISNIISKCGAIVTQIDSKEDNQLDSKIDSNIYSKLYSYLFIKLTNKLIKLNDKNLFNRLLTNDLTNDLSINLFNKLKDIILLSNSHSISNLLDIEINQLLNDLLELITWSISLQSKDRFYDSYINNYIYSNLSTNTLSIESIDILNSLNDISIHLIYLYRDLTITYLPDLSYNYIFTFIESINKKLVNSSNEISKYEYLSLNYLSSICSTISLSTSLTNQSIKQNIKQFIGLYINNFSELIDRLISNYSTNQLTNCDILQSIIPIVNLYIGGTIVITNRMPETHSHLVEARIVYILTQLVVEVDRKVVEDTNEEKIIHSAFKCFIVLSMQSKYTLNYLSNLPNLKSLIDRYINLYKDLTIDSFDCINSLWHRTINPCYVILLDITIHQSAIEIITRHIDLLDHSLTNAVTNLLSIYPNELLVDQVDSYNNKENLELTNNQYKKIKYLVNKIANNIIELLDVITTYHTTINLSNQIKEKFICLFDSVVQNVSSIKSIDTIANNLFNNILKAIKVIKLIFSNDNYRKID